MVSVFVIREVSAGLTGYSGPGWARTGLARRCRCQPSASKDWPAKPKTAKRQPRTSKCSQFVEYFCTCRQICRNVQSASTLEQNPFVLGLGRQNSPTFRTFFDVCLRRWLMYAFPILLNIGVAFGVLWDSKASKNEHKTAWDL